MINAQILRATLKEIFGVEDKYLVPISTNWFLPTTDSEDKVGTWIGYRIIDTRPYVRAYMGLNGRNRNLIHKPIKVSFRLTFVGPQAEELADQTLLWEDRGDVSDAFAKSNTQINYSDRTSFTYPVRNGGYNDDLAWIVDMQCQTEYIVDTGQEPWIIN